MATKTKKAPKPRARKPRVKMQQHGVGHYVTADGLVVDVTDKTNVRVKRRHEENGAGE